VEFRVSAREPSPSMHHKENKRKRNKEEKNIHDEVNLGVP
jgi:hypothetical protein